VFCEPKSHCCVHLASEAIAFSTQLQLQSGLKWHEGLHHSPLIPRFPRGGWRVATELMTQLGAVATNQVWRTPSIKSPGESGGSGDGLPKTPTSGMKPFWLGLSVAVNILHAQPHPPVLHR